jgi:hypothetical protein
MTLRVKDYVREDGTVPLKDWFERLGPHAAAKVVTAVTRLSLRDGPPQARRKR